MIGSRLPALLLHQCQGILGVQSPVDQHGTGEQDAAPDAMFAMDETATPLFNFFMYPGCALPQLFDG